MMRLLSGVALAALIAVPVWAQAPGNTPNPNAQSGAPAASAQTPNAGQNAATTEKSTKQTTRKEAARAPRKHRGMHAMRHGMRHEMRSARRHAQMRYAGGMHRMWGHPSYGMHRYGMHRHWSWYRPHRYSMYRHWGWYGPHRMYGAHYGWGRVHGPTDFMAQQLNRQELGQIYSGGGMPPAQPSGY
jgi:hypothetical protein